MRSKKYKQKKDIKNEVDYEESSVIDEVPRYFNIFECGRNILSRLDVKYERVCMANPKEKYYPKVLETIIDYNDHHNAPFSTEKIQQAIRTVMEETEEEESDAKCNANNVTIDSFCQSPVMTNTQGNIENVPNERQISPEILAETIKGFKVLTLQSTINNSSFYRSEEDYTESDPNSDLKVDTHTSDRKKRKVTDTETTNGNSPHKSLINRLIPEIIPFVIPSTD